MPSTFFDRMSAPSPLIVVDQTASVAAGVSALDAAICHFEDGGHVWIDVTKIDDLNPSWQCRCGVIGKDAQR